MIALITQKWWALLARGIAAIILGVFTLILPALTLRILVLLFGVYTLIDGFFTGIAALLHRKDVARWWLFLSEGIVSIAVGVLALVWPAIMLIVLFYLIAGWAIITGILEITAGIQLRKDFKGEWLLLFAGIVSVLFGAFLLLFPEQGLMALIWLLAIYAVLFGVLLCALSLRARSIKGGG